MAFNVTPLKTWGERLRASFRAEMPGSDAWLWPNTIGVIAKVVAAWLFQIELRIRWAMRQFFVSTAEGEWLDRRGADYGISRKSATYAQGIVRFSGTIGASIASGLSLTRSDGVIYTTDEGGTIGSVGYVDVPVTASLTGPNGNAISGTSLAISAALPGVTATVNPDGIGQGADIEGDESLRTRILLRLQYPPHGGAESDYVQWALSRPGVTRAWARGNAFGRGSVGVWVMMDNSYADGIPQAADIDAIADYIETVRPITATVTVLAPEKELVNITIKGMTGNNQATKNAAYTALVDLFQRVATPGMPDKPSSIRVSWIWQAVSNAAGENYHTVTVPAADLSFASGKLPALGTVTFED